ncbi:hypothetical protein CC79DRAFT_475255 [Sarocladium strictum]
MKCKMNSVKAPTVNVERRRESPAPQRVSLVSPSLPFSMPSKTQGTPPREASSPVPHLLDVASKLPTKLTLVLPVFRTYHLTAL